MSQIVILAGTVQEASKYTRAVSLPRGRYICPMSAAQIDGVVPSEVHILPGFRRRRDIHAIMATVKRSSRRYQGVKFVEFDERGPVTDRVLEVAYRHNRLRRLGMDDAIEEIVTERADLLGRLATDDEVAVALTQISDTDVGPDEPKRRRSRCKVCDTLHFPGECPGPEIFE